MTSIFTPGGLLPVMVPTVTLRVDGVEVRVARGAMLLEAVQAASVALPSLCKPEARGPLGACRTCLVEVEGRGGSPPRATHRLPRGSRSGRRASVPSACGAASSI